MGKTREELARSREKRAEILQRFGGSLPLSIMKHAKHDKAIDLIHENGRAYERASQVLKKDVSERPQFTGDEARAFEISGKTCRGKGGGLSRFPQNIGRALLQLYTKKGDTIFDPFAGHNSRMELCWRLGLNYVGCDVSREFMIANREIRKMLLTEHERDLFPETLSKATITLLECDSRSVPLSDDLQADATITSPPYYDLEFYGDETEQLGKSASYEDFLVGMQQVARENFRLLRAGAFCVWFVNDFRRAGRFHNYHGHTIDLLLEAGFEQWDIAIVDLGSAMRAAFAQQVVDSKIIPKKHEYAIVMRKP